jgi:hypothetical protein
MAGKSTGSLDDMRHFFCDSSENDMAKSQSEF